MADNKEPQAGANTTAKNSQGTAGSQSVKAEDAPPKAKVFLSSAKHPKDAEPKELAGKYVYPGFSQVQVSRTSIVLPTTKDGQPDSEAQRKGFDLTTGEANLLLSTYPGIYKPSSDKGGSE